MLYGNNVLTITHAIWQQCGNNNTCYISIAECIYIGINFGGLFAMSCQQAWNLKLVIKWAIFRYSVGRHVNF